jgi:hypothetical protein
MDIISFLHSIKIIDIQNISLFILSLFTFLSYLYYNLGPFLYDKNNDFTKPLELLIPFVILHAFIDLFLTKSNDLRLHHIFIFGISIYNYSLNASSEDRFKFLYPLLKTEISSIFYIFKYWLCKNSILYDLNSLIFYILFFKLRIYDFYYEILYNNILIDEIFQKYSISNFNLNYYLSYFFLISCYGLYILNLYWFFIMNKILYKTITKIINNIDTDILRHKLCSFVVWLNIPIAYYIYSYYPNQKYFFDMFGICILCLTSYNYHYDIYERLKTKQIENYELPNKDNIIKFMDDIIAINARSFLALLSNYYYNENVYSLLLLSGIFHTLSIYLCYGNSFELIIDYENKKEVFLNFHNIVTEIPIIFDVFLVFINSPNEIKIPFLLVNVIIGILFIVEPFYKLTHSFFHIFLLIQTYYICLSNIR